MARLATISLILIITYLFVNTADVYGRNINEKTSLRGGKDKTVKLKFYVQDLRVGNPNPTVYEVGRASVTGNSPTEFGSVHVVDDLLTAEPDFNSRVVGRVQGLTTSGDMAVNAVAINLNFYFTSGKFNGSTISVLGRNEVMQPQRELPVAGGTGAFRYARGYAITKNIFNDAELHYSVLEYTIYTTYNTAFTAYNSGSGEIDEDVEVADM